MTQAIRGDTVYDLGPCLGKGGFGVCYKATERHRDGPQKQGRTVAVKQISEQLVREAEKEPYLRYEIALHGQLRHRNVAELFATFSNSGSIYFVLEYCSKKSLADVIVRVTTLPVDLAAYYFSQMMTGLAYIHGCCILHRDLKLSNILVDANNVVKISDFGLSCTTTRSYLERHLACGTPNYLSPEVLLRQGHTAKSDIWSCGVVLYAMFGGIPPFQADELADIYRNIVAGGYHFTRYHCDDRLKDLLAQLLQLDPEERPSVEVALAHEFTRYSDQYESSQLAGDAKVSTGCGASLGRRNQAKRSATLLSRSLTSLFLGGKSAAAKQLESASNNGTSNSARGSSSCSSRSKLYNTRQQCKASVPRSFTTVVDVKLMRISQLLELFRARPAWRKRATDFHAGWLAWWRDKTSTVGFYYQLSNGFNCALYNDATSCLHNTGSGRVHFINLRSGRRIHSEASARLDLVNKFYEPLLRDLLEEFQDVATSNRVGEEVSWVSQGCRRVDDAEAACAYLVNWSSHCNGTYRVFYMSDESIQVNFGATFLLRVCGRLCYFYQPARKGFLVETKSLDAWCFQEINSELVDVLCGIFLV